MSNKGTPKTLEQAIINGLEEYGFQNNTKIAKVIYPHIRDFLAQKAFDRDHVKEEHFIEYFDKIFKGAA